MTSASELPPDLARRKPRLRRAMLGWFDHAARDLPWRRTSDPYRVWLSEILLQQTRVEAVIPYYERFLETCPTVEALARAPLDRVLKLWEGLGYYSRARNLHRCAEIVADQLDGRFPDTVEDLRRLPGVGPYTAGAVASIAFGRAAALVDGNVKRVFARWFAESRPVDDGKVTEAFWRIAESLVRGKRPGDWNQSLMELGATVCLPRTPRCDACPASRLCAARQAGREKDLPLRRRKKRIPHKTVVAAWAKRRGRILVVRRPESGMLGGLWEFPGGAVEPGEDHAAALARILAAEVGLELATIPDVPAASVEHAYSHFRITFHLYPATVRGRTRALACDAARWVTPVELDALALPAADRKALKIIR